MSGLQPQRVPLRLRLAVLTGRTAGRLSRVLGAGQGGTVPGRVVSVLFPSSLRRLAQGRTVVLISGTNGKSTTTAMLVAALGTQGAVVSNTDGANLISGLTGALMSDVEARTAAVLEVDEVVLPKAVRDTCPSIVVLLNLSRDQLDRVGEVPSHATRWSAALSAAPDAWVVANADDPLVVDAVRSARPTGSKVVWVAAGGPWRADTPTCTGCGFPWATDIHPWGCSRCGLAAPDPTWTLSGDVACGPEVREQLDLRLPGRVNQANALMTLAAATLAGVCAPTAAAALRMLDQVGGRYWQGSYAGHTVRLLLAKNPAGWGELLDELAHQPADLLLGINAEPADGVDPSWLWDVPFERLKGRTVVLFGQCALDLGVRLHYAEVDYRTAASIEQALAMTGPTVTIAANYTAFVRARHVLGC